MTDAAAVAGKAAPYEELLRSSRAELVLRDGWVLGRYPAVPLTPPIDWSFRGEAARSHNYHLHALDLIDPLLAAHSAGETAAPYLDRAFAVAMDWVRAHPSADAEGRSPMAWYDMAVGLRAYRLAYVLDAAEREGLGTPEDRALLAASLDAHRENLVHDEGFAAHSNHGLYQALGQLAMARRLIARPGMAEAAAQSRERLHAVIDAQFTAEGVHKEHSPGYHLRVLETLSGAEAAGLFDTPDLARRVAEAREALAWFIKPNGKLVNFGDTDEARANPALVKDLAPEGLRVFPQSGYVVARAEGFYFAQTLAYHSRTHKQADDLSFVWSEHGRDILIDAGRFGYRGRTEPGTDLWRRGFWYGDPSRVYVESTHAHNTVEIDGESYNRKAEAPYGSALIWGGLSDDGQVVSLGEVDHGAQGRHRRLLVLEPGSWLVVVDRIDPPPGGARSKGLLGRLIGPGGRDYRQWFHVSPEFTVAVSGRAAFTASEPTHETRLQALSLAPGVSVSDPVLGQTEPRLQGWTSPKEGALDPAPAIAMETTSEGTVVFATLFTLGVSSLRGGEAELKDGGDGLSLRWNADGAPRRLEITGFLGATPKVRSA